MYKTGTKASAIRFTKRIGHHPQTEHNPCDSGSLSGLPELRLVILDSLSPWFAIALDAEPKVLCVTVYARGAAYAQSGVHLHLGFGISCYRVLARLGRHGFRKSPVM
jgi:hypothetical protein